MTRAKAVEPWNSKPIAEPKTGFIVARFSQWLELLRRGLNIAISGAVTSINIDASTTISNGVDVVYGTGAITITLPPGANYIHPVTIKNIGVATIILESSGLELVENAANAALLAKDSYTMGFDGTDWWII